MKRRCRAAGAAIAAERKRDDAVMLEYCNDVSPMAQAFVVVVDLAGVNQSWLLMGWVYNSTVGGVGRTFKLLLPRPCWVSSYSELPCLVMSYFSPSPQRA